MKDGFEDIKNEVSKTTGVLEKKLESSKKKPRVCNKFGIIKVKAGIRYIPPPSTFKKQIHMLIDCNDSLIT